MKQSSSNQQAFTILELLIATMIFSVILLLVTTGVLQIGKTYYKGLLQSRTQETARNIINEISQGIQFSGETVQPTAPSNPAANPYPRSGGVGKYTFCINGIGYAYVLDRELSTAAGPNKVSKTLISFSTPCNGFNPSAHDVATKTGKELLGQGMHLSELNVTDNGNSTYTIRVGIASGEFDLFNTNANGIHHQCRSGAGSQFCAVSILTTTVHKRVK